MNKLMLALWLVVASLCSEAHTDNALDVVTGPDRITRIQLSRDGKTVGFVENDKGRAWLKLKRVKDSAERVVAPWGGADNYQIAADGRSFLLLFGMGTADSRLVLWRESGDHFEPTSVRVNHRVAGFGRSGPRSYELMTQSSDGRVVFVSVDPKSGRVTTRRTDSDIEDVAYKPDGQPGAIQRSTGVWISADAHCKPSSNFESTASNVLATTVDGCTLYFRAKTNEGFETIRSLDLRSGKVSEVASGKRFDVTWTTFHPITGHLQATATDQSSVQWTAVDPSIKAALADLYEHAYGSVYIGDRSDDDRFWLLADVSGRHPTEYSVYDRRVHKLTHLFRVRLNPGAPSVPEASSRWVTSADGRSIQVLVSAPLRTRCDPVNNGCPYVLKLHGGPHRRDTVMFDPETYWLQRQGYWVLRVNYRGSTGFGDAFSHASDGEWGGRVIDDIDAAVSWFVTQPGVQADNGSAMGGSFGGFAATALSVRRPDIRCVVSFNGGGDFEAFTRLVAERQPAMADDIRQEVGSLDDLEQLAKVRAQSPLNNIAKIRAQTLIEYGAKDVISIPEASKNFAEALLKRGTPVAVATYPSVGHDFTDEAIKQIHYELVSRFLGQCMTDASTNLSPLSLGDAVILEGSTSILSNLAAIP